MKKSFVLYHDQYEAIEDLTAEQKGQLLDAIFIYNTKNEIIVADPIVKMAFNFFKLAFDRDDVKWQERAERNKNNGKKGGRPKKKKTAAKIPHEGDDLNPDEQEQPENFLLTKKKKKLSGKRLEAFEVFWNLFNYKKGKAEAADAWLEIPKLTDAICGQINKAAQIESINREELKSQGRTPKMAQGWITGRRWEDDIYQNIGQEDRQADIMRQAEEMKKILAKKEQSNVRL